MPDMRAGRSNSGAAGMMGLALFLALLFPMAVQGTAQGAEPLKDWPCKDPLVAPITADMVWPDRHPEVLAALPPDRAWESDARIHDVVEFIANPENSPGVGREAIARFAKGIDGDRRAELALVLSGAVDLTNRLRGIMVDGIGVNVVRSKILAEEVNANTAAMTNISSNTGNGTAATEADVRQARFWNLRRLDKTEDDAAMICRKLAYSERKLRALAQAVSEAMD
jgi:hypothetical protein